eukprot:TRINITY_DN4152_c5_g1_i1.p1 TRINITY_DN4152_c5_g1~~TRINITY_DN4152_c5_g1_i1.p1  ORF type:complete len:300 (+),score=52.35 TRINITY_DN4152_c5_g1_i1:231-1130(+)
MKHNELLWTRSLVLVVLLSTCIATLSPASGYDDIVVSDLQDEEYATAAPGAIDLASYDNDDLLKGRNAFMEADRAPARVQQQQQQQQEQQQQAEATATTTTTTTTTFTAPTAGTGVRHPHAGHHHGAHASPHMRPHSQHPHPSVYGDHTRHSASSHDVLRQRHAQQQAMHAHRQREAAVGAHRDPYHAAIERQHEALRRERLQREMEHRRFEQQQQAALEARQRYLQQLEAQRQARLREQLARQRGQDLGWGDGFGYRPRLGHAWPRRRLHHPSLHVPQYRGYRHPFDDGMDIDSGWGY